MTEEVKKNQGNTSTLIAVMQNDLSHIQKTMQSMHDEMKDGFARLERGLVPRAEYEDLKRRVDILEGNQSWAIRQVVGPVLGGLALAIAAIQYFVN